MEHQNHPLFNVSCQNMARGSMYFGGLPLSLFASSSQRQPTGSTPVDTRKLYRTIILSAMANLSNEKGADPSAGSQLVEKGSGWFRMDPPSALRLWAGGFRLAVSTTFLNNKAEERVFKTKQFLCGGKFHRLLRSKMTAGLLAVKMGLRNVLGRFVATPESTAWDSYPLRGIRPHNAFGKKDFQSCFPKRLGPNFTF